VPKYPTFLSDLAESDRTHIRNCVNKLLLLLRGCESRLRLYAAEDPGELHRSGQPVFKLLQDLKITSAMIDAMTNELIQKYGLPENIKQIADDFRQDMRSVLIGVVPPE
jgi:hypothetical protein